jgi:tubulin polyglutamylase TTLL1
LSNRGQGITVIDEIYELNNIIRKKEKHFNGSEKTYIVQKYLEKPLLYKGRKFDIRHYMMISRLHGVMRAYWFSEGYVRTSSYDYDIGDIGDEMIHLTNDAIQKYSDGYGKHEEGNKVSYNEFQRYMDSAVGEGKFSFSEMIYSRMKAIALDAVKATCLQLDPSNTEHNFEIFGLDFMIDH